MTPILSESSLIANSLTANHHGGHEDLARVGLVQFFSEGSLLVLEFLFVTQVRRIVIFAETQRRHADQFYLGSHVCH